MTANLPFVYGAMTAILVFMIGTIIFQHVRAWLRRRPGYWHRRIA